MRDHSEFLVGTHFKLRLMYLIWRTILYSQSCPIPHKITSMRDERPESKHLPLTNTGSVDAYGNKRHAFGTFGTFLRQ